MGNINNTHIEYWTKSGYKISYLFWDLKGKNRFPEQLSDPEITAMFNKCLQEIDISSYQLKAIQQFTPKYKYRFVVLHKKKVKQAAKQQQIQKFSRESFQMHFAQEAKTMQSKKKIQQLQKLLMNVQLNEASIKNSLMNLQNFISDKLAQNEFIEMRGIERILSHLQSAIRMNEKGTKTSFASQIELLKFLRIFSDRFSKQFYFYLPLIRSYTMTIIQSYHPINTQIIAYSLSLLSDFVWKVQPQHEQNSLIQVLQRHRVQMNLQSFLSPFIESIIESDSIVNVYHNIKFVNELVASAMGKRDKDLLEETLIKTKYTIVLENVKLRLETMHYSIEKTTFIAIYQKIFKYSLAKEGVIKQKQNIDSIIEENFRNSVLISHRNSLEALHKQAIATLIQEQSQIASQSYPSGHEPSNQLVTYLNDNDRRQFNKLIFDTLTEMQKYYKLQFYLQTTHETQQSNPNSNYQKAKQLIDSRIIQHNTETYFNKIKHQCLQNKSIQILNSCLQKIQTFTLQQWKELEKWIYQGNQQTLQLHQQVESLKNQLEEKKNKIKTLIKQNNDLKDKYQQVESSSRKNSLNIETMQSTTLKPPPSLQESLLTTTISQNFNNTFVIPSLPPLPLDLPTIPVFNLNLSIKQKPKRQPPTALKACNYTTIAYDKIKNSVFEEIDDSKVEIDENQIVKLFAKNIESQTSKSRLTQPSSFETIVNGVRSDRLTLPGSFKETVQLLRPDRAKNIQIVLAKLKIPKGQFKKVLVECNGGKFMSHHNLQAIEKILPTQEEQQLISSFEGNEKDLGVSERFFKQLIQVPEYTSRIKVMLFSHANEQIYHEIESKIDQLSKGLSSLRQNNRLKCVIQNCLAIGNFLNGQSVKGGAWGFRLQTIQRLEQVKTADGKMNGALYLIKQLWKHYEYPLFDRSEIELYQYLAKMPLSQVKHEIDELQIFMNAINKACKSKDKSNQKDKIVTFCQRFQQQVSQKLFSFKSQFEQLKELFVKCASYYCEDSKTLASDEFGKKMYKCILFISNTQKVYKVIEEQNLKSSRYRTTSKNISYNSSGIPEKFRESLIDIKQENGFQVEKQDEGLSKTTALVLQSGKTKQERVSFKKKQTESSTIHLAQLNKPQAMIPITHNERASHRLSFIFEIHKPTKPLEQLSHQQIQTELKAIQRESMNRAMEDMIKRRTQKFQNITARFSKANILAENDNSVQVESRISFLKKVENQRNS